MAEAAATPVEAKPKRGKLPLLLGLVAALGLGGGGFYVTYSGMIGGTSSQPADDGHDAIAGLSSMAFVPVDPLVISLGPAGKSQHLRFAAQLEVDTGHQGEVALLTPRILDVLNSYLRAVEVAELEDPTALIRIRAQMLRRIQMVTGEGRVRDLLITEFVLN